MFPYIFRLPINIIIILTEEDKFTNENDNKGIYSSSCCQRN